MSFWGATVIINFLTVIPYIGITLALMIWGGYNVGKATLGRFFNLHLVIPFIISLLVIIHIYYLHQSGSSNALIHDVKEPIKFSCYFTLKDIMALIIVFITFTEIIVQRFNLGHSANYILASPLVTPELIVPEWYFLCS